MTIPTHRAEQIVAAIAAAIASVFAGTVYTHRALSLSEADGELPAVSVDFGDDAPLDNTGVSNFAFIDSLLAIETSIYLRDNEETTVKSALLAARRVIHVALMADRSLGLDDFVIDTRYGGAAAPQMNATTEYVAGLLVCRWSVYYRMNIADPG